MQRAGQMTGGATLHPSVDPRMWMWWETIFRAKCYELIEQAYQDFFVRVMSMRHGPDFEPVAPWGSDGDLSCDGYVRSRRVVFQVYAPARLVQSKCLAKIRNDHAGAQDHWRDHVDTWAFVHNRTDGLPGKVTILFKQLMKKAAWLQIEPWGREALKDQVRGLSDVQLIELLGPVPTLTPSSVRQEDLRIVIRRLMAAIEHQRPNRQENVRRVPKTKLALNNLGPSSQEMLRLGARFSARVRAQLDSDTDIELGGRLAAGFRAKYKLLRDRDQLPPDDIFSQLYRFSVGDLTVSMPEQVAALAVLAYLFETCHIFEDPSR
jgi:hypothetical protein